MDVILVMMLSGSCMVLFYLLLKLLLGEKLSAAWRYRLLKAVILYYLIPPFFLKNIYEGVAAKLFSAKDGASSGEVIQIFQNKSLIFSDGESIYLNAALQKMILTGGICCLAVLLVMAVSFFRYHTARKRLLQCRGNAEAKEEQLVLQELQKDWKLKRRVRCLKYSGSTAHEKGAFTIGVLKPVIFCMGNETGEDRTLMLKHEMQHIKGFDVLWKILGSCAWALHWYNPLVWWLNRELESICEMACDESVLRNADEETVQRYMMLVIETASASENFFGKNGLWSFALSKDGEKIKRRILNMKRRNQYWKKQASLAVVMLAVLLNSVTVFAYEDVQWFELTNANGEPVDVENALRSDFVFYPNTADKSELEGTFAEDPMPEIKYDVQFTDENGTIYPVDELQVCATCKHTWIYGTVEDHDKHSDGSCTITQYEAKRCTKCGTTVTGEEINKISYTKCPH